MVELQIQQKIRSKVTLSRAFTLVAVADPAVVPRVPGHHPRLQGWTQFQTHIGLTASLGTPFTMLQLRKLSLS